jgi:glucose-specific phosphotransferase system IIA component
MPSDETTVDGRRPLFGRRRRAEQPAPAAVPATPAAPGETVAGAPVAGTAIPLAEVEDPAFSAGMIGPGVAVRPADGLVVAPVGGTVVSAMPHAYGIRTASGVELLVHIGIDTVSLNGRHFEPQVVAGQQVALGDPLARVDLAAVAAEGCPTTVVLVVTNAATLGGVEPHEPGPVAAGQAVLTVRA